MSDEVPRAVELTQLAKAIEELPPDRALLVVTGAGVSLASGIPTFRGSDPEAVWAKDVTELGTHRYFAKQPAGSWRWYLSRFSNLEDKQPNDAHRAIADLERWRIEGGGTFLLVTQNVDCLHEGAGSTEMVKVHGTSDRVRCTNVRKCALAAPTGSIPRQNLDMSKFLQDPVDANVPRCPECGSLLRQHILWFDECYDDHVDYQIDRILKIVKRCGVVLFVGTSFSVGITEMILTKARASGAKIFSIDPSGMIPHPKIEVIKMRAEDGLPELVALCRK